jgi:hypothetical protein
MSETLITILKDVADRLRVQAASYLPPLIAAMLVIGLAIVVATLARRALRRLFKGIALDRFMRRTGVAHLIDRSGRLRATRLVAQTAYWSILIFGALAGLSVFGADLTNQLIQTFALLIPRLVIGALIILAGAWLSQYLGRCMLVWAFTENLLYPRRLAAGVRVFTIFVAVVVTADYLNFARSVFLTAFIIFVGGLVLAASLAVGIGASNRVRTYLHDNDKTGLEEEERSLWTHL